MKSLILGTGLHGLLGNHITHYLDSRYSFDDISEQNIDITDKEAIKRAITNSKATTILHLAAMTNVDLCEQDKYLGKNGRAWQVNVEGTRNIVYAAKELQKKVIFISTDFVFDGEKEWYGENDQPHPINWYGVTKFEAEKIILNQSHNCVVRLAYPFGMNHPKKKDFMTIFLENLASGKLMALTDHYFTPTFADDIASSLQQIIDKDATGILHVVGSMSLTPFEAGQEIARNFGYPVSSVAMTTCDVFYKNRAKRPYKLRLKNDTINALGMRMKSFSEAVLFIKNKL